MHKKFDTIEMLIDCGADIDAQNSSGKTPLMISAQMGDEELIDFLIDYGADKSLRDNGSNTAYDLALKSKNPKCSDIIKQDRPIKPNPAKLTRAKSKTDSSLTEDYRPTSDDKEKFDNIFSGGNNNKNTSNNNNNKSDASQGFVPKSMQASNSKYHDSNASKLTSEDKLDAAKSNKSDKIESWVDSDEDEDDDLGASPRSKAPGGGDTSNRNNETFDSIFANSTFQNNKNKSNTNDEEILDIDVNDGKF